MCVQRSWTSTKQALIRANLGLDKHYRPSSDMREPVARTNGSGPWLNWDSFVKNELATLLEQERETAPAPCRPVFLLGQYLT